MGTAKVNRGTKSTVLDGRVRTQDVHPATEYRDDGKPMMIGGEEAGAGRPVRPKTPRWLVQTGVRG
jgi:hypothetical protein